ncbi:MAG: dynamin family protein [Verrucomicrobiae bacterium]|nr:dynamin family protein [Verrucomicrobiae bacterium]
MDDAILIDTLSRLCARFHLDSLSAQLDACRETMRDGDIVDVAVVGRFKAGKSSFLNSIIGRPIMPVAALPVTAVVTRLGCGPTDRAVVRHQTGETVEIPLHRLAEFVTEQQNPGNARQVAMVDVELQCLEPYRGLRFVDTPGLGSVFAHNTRASMEWLPRIGAALLAVSADQPLSEQDIQLLREMSRHTPEIAILVTKADLLSAGDLSEVMDFMRTQIARHLGHGLPVYAYSVRDSFGPLRTAVRDQLLRRLATRHADEARAILRHKMRSLIAGCREYLNLALQAAAAAEESRVALQLQLDQERQDLDAVQSEIRVLAGDLKSRLQADATKHFLAHDGELASRLRDELRAKMPGWRGDLRQTIAAFSAWAAGALEEELRRVSPGVGARLTNYLTEAEASFSRVVRAFQDRLSAHIKRALHTSFAGAQFEVALKQPVTPDIRVGRVFDIALEMIWFLIPMWLFRPLVNRKFLHAVPWQTQVNLYRAAAQWTEAVAASIDDVARQAREFILNELATVETMVASTEDRRREILAALAELESCDPPRLPDAQTAPNTHEPLEAALDH